MESRRNDSRDVEEGLIRYHGPSTPRSGKFLARGTGGQVAAQWGQQRNWVRNVCFLVVLPGFTRYSEASAALIPRV